MKQSLSVACAGLLLGALGACSTAPTAGTPQASSSPTLRENCVFLTGSRVCRDPSKVAGDVTIISPKAMREQPSQTNGGLGNLTPSN